MTKDQSRQDYAHAISMDLLKQNLNMQKERLKVKTQQEGRNRSLLNKNGSQTRNVVCSKPPLQSSALVIPKLPASQHDLLQNDPPKVSPNSIVSQPQQVMKPVLQSLATQQRATKRACSSVYKPSSTDGQTFLILGEKNSQPPNNITKDDLNDVISREDIGKSLTTDSQHQV